MHFHVCRSTVAVAVVILASFGAPSPAAAAPNDAPSTVVAVPLEPEPAYTPGMSPAQHRAESERWRAAHDAWAKSLTAEQKAEIKRRRAEEQRRLNEDFARRQRLPEPGDGYDWRSRAKAMKLEDRVVEQLSRDKIAYGYSVKQSFEPYLRGPVFVTSDSILNGFHVLFEDSFRELEESAVFDLRTSLETVLEQARANLGDSPYPAADTAPSMRHAQLVLGPALVLLGTSPDRLDPEVRDEVARQVAKLRAADTAELPEWLGPESTTLIRIDYRRAKPVGFYAGNPRLSDYFRAVRWLQLVPFRADRPVELGAIAMLGYGLNRAFDTPAREFFNGYDAMLGRREGKNLPAAAYDFQNFIVGRNGSDTWAAHLVHTQRALLWEFEDHDAAPELIVDDRLPPALGERLSEIQYRIIAGYRLPDSVLLQEFARAGAPPQGLAVAAMLGSRFAREHLKDVTTDQFEKALHAVSGKPGARQTERDSLYDRYLDVLRATQEPVPTEAPDLFRSKAWEAKSCQTILASWAQMRHTFTLQAHPSALYLGVNMTPPGFVEPNPEFFSRFAELVTVTKTSIESRGGFSTTAQREAERLRADAAFIESYDARDFRAGNLPPEEELDRYENLIHTVAHPTDRLAPTIKRPKQDATEADRAAFHRECATALRAKADLCDRGGLIAPVRMNLMRLRWETLERLARRLEALAHKQLAKRPWNASESTFLKRYGEELAFVIGYEGNSWLHADDDAPRWVEIHRDPAANALLAAGVGRPREILVLYPWQGMEILCSGSVMPYFEYRTTERLTDREWLTLLSSDKAPDLPEWMQPYMAPAGFAPERTH
jgi:hypothetical protein